MKKTLLLAATLMIGGFSFGQDLPKGPKAKNQKIWEKKREVNLLTAFESPQFEKGVNAKSSKFWTSESKTLNVQTRTEINNPKGLEAKNQKVWENSKKVKVNSKASYIEPKALKKKKFWWH
ncbi:hypothetical protein [Algoriphagus hitonicola]|uniref:Uncharacterized protein n=1 Tax=Algoriphagus hitonicola TaxID=435880 RepID=A0A1I2VBW6_9BACT|nr:hypothetical protein [Algoriphagus hitonicola]SFG86722.1 hypothetical protein SAMN04487988_109121 [Algoriphagus hitonicola]